MVSKPLVSIITINRNNLVGLQRTIASVLGQTWKEFEYIVIDGDSSDGSAEFIRTKDSLIDKWISEPDTGIYNAMNKGIKMASGEYLLFLNSGDELYSSNILEQNKDDIKEVDLVYFNIQMISDDKAYIHKYPDKLNFEFFQRSALGHPVTFIKKTLFDDIGYYDESLKIVSDWKFFITAVVYKKCSYKKIDRVFSKFYKDGISSIYKDLCDEERALVLEEEFKMELLKHKFKMAVYKFRMNYLK